MFVDQADVAPVCMRVDKFSDGNLRIPVANGLTDDEVGVAAIGQEGGQSYSPLNALHDSE